VPRPFRKVLAGATVLAGILIPATAAFANGETSSPTATSSPETAYSLGDASVNTSVSMNDHDGSSVFHLSFRIARLSGADDDVSDVAVAMSDCTDCQSVAIAVQIDLISPVPAVLTASTTAVAANVDCVLCNTLAAAFQYVVATPEPLVLTPAGRQEIHWIERALDRLGRSDENPADMEAQIQDLADDLSQVLSTQLVPAPELDYQHGWRR
jgi:hypothetical protein